MKDKDVIEEVMEEPTPWIQLLREAVRLRHYSPVEMHEALHTAYQMGAKQVLDKSFIQRVDSINEALKEGENLIMFRDDQYPQMMESK